MTPSVTTRTSSDAPGGLTTTTSAVATTGPTRPTSPNESPGTDAKAAPSITEQTANTTERSVHPARSGLLAATASGMANIKSTGMKVIEVRHGNGPPIADGSSPSPVPLGQPADPTQPHIETAAFRTVLGIRDRNTPEEVLSALIDPDFAPDAAHQQHAVVTVRGGAAAFTGSSNAEVAIDAQGPNVSVQGIALADPAVVTEALNEYRKQADAKLPLSERLSQALLAGSKAGGDAACGDQTAKFAQVVVAKPDDHQKPSILATSVAAGNGENPVESIQDKVTNATRLASDGKGRLILGASGFALILGGALFVAFRSSRSTVSIPEGMRTAADDTGPRPALMSEEDPVAMLHDLADLVEGPQPPDASI